MRKRIYIAGPISSSGSLADNINQATAAWVRLAKAGFAPFCPHWSAFSGDKCLAPATHINGVWDIDRDVCMTMGKKVGHRELSHADYLDMDVAWIEVCHALLRLPGESKGADIEVTFAKERGIPVFYDIEHLCTPGVL